MNNNQKSYKVIKKNSFNFKEINNYILIYKKYLSKNFYLVKRAYGIFNSLLQNEGIYNYSKCAKIDQLLRYPNLLNQASSSNYWKSNHE